MEKENEKLRTKRGASRREQTIESEAPVVRRPTYTTKQRTVK